MANGDPPTFTRGQVLKADDLMALVQWAVDKFKSLDTGGSTGGIQADNSNEPTSDLFAPIFPCKSTGADITGAALSMKWQEQTVANNTLGDFTDGRNCSNATSVSAVTGFAAAGFLCIEIKDPPDHQYLWLPNGDFQVYLAQSGGANGDDGSTTTAAFPTYTYDVYLDAAKTIKIGAALSVLWHRPLKIAVHAATYGRARVEDQTVILLEVDEWFDDGSCP